MPRYYFNIHDGMCYPDPDGIDLISSDYAKIMALSFVGDLAKLYSDRIIRGQRLFIEVTDGQAEPIFTLQINLILAAPH